MKNLPLSHAALLCSLAFVSLAFAEDDPEPISIGSDSRNEVTFAALRGALAGFGAYAGFRLLTNNFTLDIFHHPYTLTASTIAGAVISAIWKYQYVPENHFIFARSELLHISKNELFLLLVTTEPDKLVGTLKDRFFREKLPLYIAFRKLYKICLAIDESKESLKVVLASTRQDLYQESTELQMIADMYLAMLRDIFKQLKNDPNFIAECNAGTLELMKDAQEAAAHAAQSSALTQQMAYLSNHYHPSEINISVNAPTREVVACALPYNS